MRERVLLRILGFTLGIIVIIHLLVAVHPDHTLPALPELISISLLSATLACMYVATRKRLQTPHWFIKRREWLVSCFGMVGSDLLYRITGFMVYISYPRASMDTMFDSSWCFS